MVDEIKERADGMQCQMFVIETQGDGGYLATLSGLAVGADAAYIHEEPFDIDNLKDDVEHMHAKTKDNVQTGIIMINERANSNYPTDIVNQMYCEEGKGLFGTTCEILGNSQQGGRPTPFDRNMGTKMGSKASDWFSERIGFAEQGRFWFFYGG